MSGPVSGDRPFAMLYRWTVASEQQDAFLARWREATIALRDEHGALGSCLTRDEKGDFVAFARWPSEAARDAAFADRGAAPPWDGILDFEAVKLWVEEDLLTGR